MARRVYMEFVRNKKYLNSLFREIYNDIRTIIKVKKERAEERKEWLTKTYVPHGSGTSKNSVLKIDLI
jgi:hypothetical protein